MALIECPECGKEVSDKAASCPNCGLPMHASAGDAKPEKSNSKELYTIRIICSIVLIVAGAYAMYQSQLSMILDADAGILGTSLSLTMIIAGAITLVLRNSRKSQLFKGIGVWIFLSGLGVFAIRTAVFTAIYEHGILCLISGIIFCVSGSLIKINNHKNIN